MALPDDESPRLLTERMRKAVPCRDNVQDILDRDGTDKHGLDIASSPALQERIIHICDDFIPAFSRQVWAKKQLSEATAQDRPQKLALRQEAEIALNEEVMSGYRQLCDALTPLLPDQEAGSVQKKAKGLLGSIIGRTATAFNATLKEKEPCYAGAETMVHNYIIDAYIKRESRANLGG